VDSLAALLAASDEGELSPTVVVTASRGPEDARSAVVATEVIDRAEIEASGARDAAELLEERSGLQLQRSFRGTELWLRGLDASYVLFLLDGERIPGRTGGALDLSRFGVEGIERIEIVRGPSSALYGSEAIGGVVNILPRESDRDFEADVLASYGLGNLVDVTGRVAARPDPRLRFDLYAGLHYADAFRRDEGESTTGSSRLQGSAGGSLDYRPDRTHRLRARVDYTQLTLQGVDTGAGRALFDRTQVQEQLFTSLEHRLEGQGGLALRTRLTYSQFREQMLLDQRGGAQLDRYEDHREHLGQLSSILRVRPHDAHVVTVGFEQIFQLLESERLVSSGQRGRLALFAQDEWIVLDEGATSLTVVPGLRLDLDSQFGDQLSPKLAVRFDPTRELVLRASYGRGFRAPSFQQLLLRFENPSAGYLVRGNPSLGAESSHGVDVGVEWEPDRALALSASFFRNDLEDMIAIVTIDDPAFPGTLFSYANIASAWTMGLESSARLRVDELLTVSAGYTLTETWDGEQARQLEGRARHRLTLSARFAYEPWELELVARAAVLLDRVFYVDPDGDGIDEAVAGDPLAQVDLRVAKRFTRHLELFVGIDNLLDAGDAFTLLRPFTVYGGARGRY
jgi:outer membrane receptor for ferrienterochelin and colicins